MKKISLLVTLAFFIATALQAQINKGSILVGGMLSYSSQKSELSSPSSTSKNSAFTISPAVGIAVKQNLIVGIGASYLRLSSSNPETTGYGGNIFVRKYLPLGKGFYLFGQSAAYVNHIKTEQGNLPYTFTTDNTINGGLSFHPGVSYAVNRKIHLELDFNSILYANYSSEKTTTMTNTGSVTTQTSTTFGITANANSFTQPSVGIQFLFAK